MHLRDIVAFLEELAPLELALESDHGRIGLILDRGNRVEKAAVALDPTDYVLEEAAREDVDLLVTHHTLFYNPVNRLSRTLSNTLKIALENEISIYVAHTNYDRVTGGINDVLAGLLGLEDVRTVDLGRVGDIEPDTLSYFAEFVAEVLDTPVWFTGEGEREVRRVMVVGGSGLKEEYIDIALNNGADCLVSGEMRHSAMRYAQAQGLALIDATHYATENPGMKRLAKLLPVETVFIDNPPQLEVIA